MIKTETKSKDNAPDGGRPEGLAETHCSAIHAAALSIIRSNGSGAISIFDLRSGLRESFDSDSIEGEIDVLRLCEASMVMLRPNQEYRFTVDPSCEKCTAAEKPYLEND